MAFAQKLVCRECGTEYPLGPHYVCEECFGPLEVHYDYDKLRQTLGASEIARRPSTLWRYRELLPVGDAPPVDMGAGFTPLVRAENLGRRLGLRNLYLKNDAANPTHSFKDRAVSVAVTMARQFDFEAAACPSTGNLANSLAAHAAKASIPAYIFIPRGLERAKILSTAVYGPTVVEVDGTYDDVNRLCTELADEFRWAFVNVNLRPYYSEGAKTLAFEVVEQLGWRAPDHVIVPIASGNLLVKIDKGLDELRRVGLLDGGPVTRVHGAQPAGCAPVADAFRRGADDVKPVRPDTIVKSLAIGNPADGIYALQTVRSTGGVVETVTDEEVVESIRLLAETEGLFTETAGGVTTGVLRRLAEAGAFRPDETVVAYITGMGLKTPEAVDGVLKAPVRIPATVRAFEEKVLGRVAVS
ncbi:MAG: threonine synthase [Armatimonadetes bacterium]|nr:threonine synthase [Armatimonadota bacterium]